MTSPRFGRVLTAMVTPFEFDGSLDLSMAATLARYLVGHGSDALVVAGSTGEGTSLSDEEKLALFAAVASAVDVPVLAGSTSADTRRSVELTARVAEAGVSGVLATTPAYARPSQAGIAAHLGRVAEATPLPVMIYDIPSRTGRKIAATTLIDLVQSHENIVALKDASADLAGAAHVKAVLGEALDLYSGDDALTLPFMAIGAVGIVSVAAHWAGEYFAAMVRAAEAGDWLEARRLNEVLAESCAFESSEAYPNPVPAKAAMRALGLDVGDCRLPHSAADGEIDARAARVLAALAASRG
jgi:4-hydroxy-tetrahydrodipicolinate synthase